MLATMARRGPDGQRSWCADRAALGQTLLATTSEAMVGIQPWVHPDTDCVVVADSRLDNRIELLRELGMGGCVVDTIGDAELLHAAYQRWGQHSAAHLLGDFAFAIWDPRNRTLFCARDQLGVRPFYYCHLPQRLFAFASEADALLRLPEVPKSLNEVRIVDFLVPQLEGFDATSTFYQAIQRMPAGHTCSIDGTHLRIRRYWTPTDELTHSPPHNDAEAAEAILALLAQAVHCRMRSNHKVGSMLSGGLDSSAIVALASKELIRTGAGPLPTFSAIDTAQACPETDAVRQMLALPGLASTPFDIADANAPWAALASYQGQMLEPFDGSMLVVAAQYLNAQRSGVRGMLDGLDADTLLSQGSMLARLLYGGHWRTALHEARGMARFHRNTISTWTFLRSDLAAAFIPDPLLKLRKRAQLAYLTRKRFARSLIAPDFARRIQLARRMAALSAKYGFVPQETPLEEHALQVTSPYLAASVERYGRVASAFACEPRHPFLDRRLLGYALALPDVQRQRDGWPKWILRRAMQDVLPEQICWRRGKEHLGWRTSRNLLQRMSDADLRDIASDRTTLGPYLNMRRLHAHLQHWLQHRDDASYEPLYAATILHAWLKRAAAVERDSMEFARD